MLEEGVSAFSLHHQKQLLLSVRTETHRPTLSKQIHATSTLSTFQNCKAAGKLVVPLQLFIIRSFIHLFRELI